MYKVICDDRTPAGRVIIGWTAADTYPDVAAADRRADQLRLDRPAATIAVMRRVDVWPDGSWHYWQVVRKLPPVQPPPAAPRPLVRGA